MAHEVVAQLLQLSKDPDNRPFIVTNEGCLPGLVMFLDNEDKEIVKMAVEVCFFAFFFGLYSRIIQTIHNLSLYEPNKDIMIKEAGLLANLRKLNATEYPLLSPTLRALEPNQPSGLASLGYSDKVHHRNHSGSHHIFHFI